MEVKAGDKIVLQPTGNMARRHTLPILDVVVLSVGRKYFKTRYGEFCIDTGWQKSDFTPNYRAFKDIEEYNNVADRENIISLLQRFDYNVLSYDKLKQIRKILRP